MISVAIVSRQMVIGGVENALIEMLKRIDYTKFSVDLYFQLSGGELFENIPEKVNVYLIPNLKLKQALFHPIKYTKKAIHFLKQNKETNYSRKCYQASKMLLPVKKKYDIAIAYHAPNTVPVFYVIDSISAKKKVLWLHGDLEKNDGNIDILKQYHDQYDYVYSVSEYINNQFTAIHPHIHSEVFHNYIDINKIISLSNAGESFTDSFDGIRLLTVARLAKQKGLDIAVDCCRIMKDDGYEIRWYVCGDGIEKEHLEDLIKQNCLKDDFILMGYSSNPYRLIKDCDIYVQTSLYEGYCTTTYEAKILNKPVITTDVSGSREQFVNGENGWIVPIDSNKIACQIEECIDNIDEIRKSPYFENNSFVSDERDINTVLQCIILS